MVDSGSSGPHRDLWALPSEELPPGAAAFLEMAREVQPDTETIEFPPPRQTRAPVVPLHAGSESPDPEAPATSWIVPEGEELPGPGSSAPHAGPGVRLLGAPGQDGGGDADGGPTDHAGDAADDGARIFLEMVDRADTVRVLPSADADPQPSVSEWLRAADDEGPEAADVLLRMVEQAMWHVSQSEDIRNEELRGRLLDLFTDFAVRRPWKDEERPEAQRVNRLGERGHE